MTTYNQLAGLRVNYVSSDPTLNTGNEGQVWYNSTSGTLKSLVQIKAWSAGSNMTTARSALAGAGTQTAGLAFGGSIPPLFSTTTNVTEEYDGSTWSPGGNLGTSRRNLSSMGTGTQTAGLAIGGFVPPATYLSSTEEYNGSSWSVGGNLATARYGIGGAGTQTLGLGFGGYSATGNSNATEEYSGAALVTKTITTSTS